MQVAVGKNVYRMSRQEYLGLLKVASEQVPFGIYAIEKKDYAELRCDKCESMSQLKKLIRGFKARGFRVLSNDGRMLKSAGLDAAEGALMSAT
ncbi:hypothetical protein DWZ08_04245 [Clostridiaceae bacterium AF29-16BH]|nr:hypothetical protein DWZ08_04245 [Clostridiaceae bacterium AF29-16BH]